MLHFLSLDGFLAQVEHPREIGAASLCCLATEAISTADTFGDVGMPNHSEFVKFLLHQARTYRGILENMFGPYDLRFVLGSIKKAIVEGGGPCVDFPNKLHLNGGCVVDIHISEWP